MRKTTLLLLALGLSTLLTSQNVVIERLPAASGTGLIATDGADGTGVYLSDQFELTAETNIGAVQIFGFASGGFDLTDVLTGMSVFIYEDVNGLPAGDPTLAGTGVLELDNIDLANVTVEGGGTSFLMNIAAANGGTEVSLGPGTYWLTAHPNTAGAPLDEPGRWNWFLSDDTSPVVEPVLIDPANLFGGGFTSWNNIAGLIAAPAASLNWILFDDAVLSVSDSTIEGLSLFPNPTNGIVNINLPANQILENVSVFDLTGRQVMDINTDVNAVDFTSFSTGVYIARLTTTDGSIQAVRIVKQ